MLPSQRLRRAFLDYFQDQQHTIVPSAPVIPHRDPSLLFTNAGMNPFKGVFLGTRQRPYRRAVSAQKCIRAGGKHNDLDQVGQTSRHLTFFEMLGNFSFGDYFKAEAIAFAWQVSTQVFGLAENKLWVTIFAGDDEAEAIWSKFVAKERILRQKENFWSMGETGPCGPCSELLFDRGPAYSEASHPLAAGGEERFLEFWNLVFMQWQKDGNGAITPLPAPCIDTGVGLERVLLLQSDAASVFATDLFAVLLQKIAALSKKEYTPSTAPGFQVIADHIRALSFAIADGVQPSNSARGYVLRKLIRRAVRHGAALGIQHPFLAQLLPPLQQTMLHCNELQRHQQRIAATLTAEEEAFQRTWKRGDQLLTESLERHKQKSTFSSAEAFKLKDTYGVPLEEIVQRTQAAGLDLDLAAYRAQAEAAKQTARHSAPLPAGLQLSAAYPPTQSICHRETECTTEIIAIIGQQGAIDRLAPGESAAIILQQTPFYAERGGQVGDRGLLLQPEAKFVVDDTQAAPHEVIVHHGTLQKGHLVAGERVIARVDGDRRRDIANNHTATHLLHWALRTVLGQQIRQAGSLVTAERLRFDFYHHHPLTSTAIARIETLINAQIRGNAAVKTYQIPYAQAQQEQDIQQLFSEAYGEQVRVVDIGCAKELCGGTHVTRLGAIGLLRISKEKSIAAGVRRLEAVTGRQAEEWIYRREALALQAAKLLQTDLAALVTTTTALIDEKRRLENALQAIKKEEQQRLASRLIACSQRQGDLRYCSHITALDAVFPLANILQRRAPDLSLILGGRNAQRCLLLVQLAPAAVAQGADARQIAQAIVPLIAGGSGGKKERAQASGKATTQLAAAMTKAEQLLTALL